jgi:hypothetical protein
MGGIPQERLNFGQNLIRDFFLQGMLARKGFTSHFGSTFSPGL